jgi:hypothetical protein
MATRTVDLGRERSEVWGDKAYLARERVFAPAVGGSEDSAIRRVRLLGFWSARAIFLIEVAYAAVFIAGFVSIGGNTSRVLPQPYLAIAEILILVLAPIMVCLMLAIHQDAPREAKPFTQVALGWMLAAAAFTTVVHFVRRLGRVLRVGSPVRGARGLRGGAMPYSCGVDSFSADLCA